jgi:hypothetical protein
MNQETIRAYEASNNIAKAGYSMGIAVTKTIKKGYPYKGENFDP